MIALVLMVISKTLLVSVPFLFKRGIDALSGSVSSNERWAWTAVALFATHGILRTLANVLHELRSIVFIRAAQRIGRQISRATFKHLHELDHAFLLTAKVGQITAIVNRGTRSVMTLFRALVLSFLPSLFELVLVCTIMGTQLNWSMSLATMVFFALYVLFTLRVNQSFIPIRRRLNDLDNEANAKATDSLMNFDTVKYFDRANFETIRFDKVLAAYEECAVRNEGMYALLNAGQAAIFNTAYALINCFGAWGVAQSALTVGDLVMAGSLFQQLSFPLQFLGWQTRELKAALVDLENLFDLLRQRPSVCDPAGAVELQLRQGGEIRFENVSFAYPELGSGQTRQVLRDVSFRVPPGKKTAIVGGSGGGKSTILRLLYRLYDVTEGDILIDGQSIRNIRQSSLRAAIGFIPQEAALFNDTIYYNIAYGNVSVSRVDVEEAARLAKIDDTIRTMPEQYETLVGERGIRLSGGEKQRVAIARAILRNPRILCLDEATSALDSKTEREITAALDELGQNRTVLVVAHRLATVVNADEILVLHEGRIVERGTHTALLALGGHYADMWLRQTEQALDDGLAATNGNAELQVVAGENGKTTDPYHNEDGVLDEYLA
jgi:ATP-binding cassette subfamily B protein